jgi:class 3 adenylate cyclase/DNA-binding NarL/FixJ family response regulator
MVMPTATLEPTVTTPKKILIVDDSFIMRRLIAEIVESDPDFRVVDSAENGKIALRKVRESKPDLVLLDLEMPEMSGLDTLRRLGLRSQCKVVILSFLASENSTESAEALRLGAVDVLQKPSGSVSLDINARMGNELLRRLRGAVGLRMRGAQPATSTASSDGETDAADDDQSSLKILVRSREVMLDNLSEGVIEFDEGLNLASFNPAAQKILRLKQLTYGVPLSDLFVDYNLEIAERIHAALARGNGESGWQFEVATDDSEWVSLRLSIVLRRLETDGHVVMLIFDDMSREKTMRDLLERLSSRSITNLQLTDVRNRHSGVSQQATLLFSDIRSFTTITERLGAGATVELLNEYFSFMEDVIVSNNGFVAQYVGDAIMAAFGVPAKLQDDAARAVRCAVQMMKALDLFNQGRKNSFPVNIGIGLASGEVIYGEIGSPTRQNYTIVGDTVNRAARIENLTKKYGARILICEQTWQNSEAGLLVRQLDRVAVRGQEKPVTLYEVLAIDPMTLPSEWLPAWEAGRSAWTDGDFARALDHFTTARRARIDDKAAGLMVERCRQLIAEPPSNWDGEWTGEMENAGRASGGT